MSRLSARRQDRMIRQLIAAHDQLGAWENSLRADLEAGTPHRTHTEKLISLLVEARGGIVQRLAELDRRCPEQPDSQAPFPIRASSGAGPQALNRASQRSLRRCVKACRACGLALVRAFREAQRATDSATANVLYGSMRAVEKQLWMLDPLQVR